MKTFLTLLALISLTWALQLKFKEIPKKDLLIAKLELENERLLKNSGVQPEIRVFKPTVKEDYSGHNSVIMSKIARLTDEKRVEKEKLRINVDQIDGYISKGLALLGAHQRIQPEFKDEGIRTSDADRKKWLEQHQAREDFLNTEIEKLEGQKEILKRSFDSFEARIDLEIQKLEREIK